MATLDTARNYTPTFLGLASQLGISAGISLLCLLQFEWNRRQKSLQYLYTARTKLSKNASPPIPPGLFSWIKHTILLDDNFYLKSVGLDALMYIRFLRMSFQFVLFNAFVVGIILAPTNYFAGGTSDGVEALSINNIPQNKTKTLWAHMICTYIVSFSWMYLLYKNYYDYMILHRDHLLKKVETDSITARTVMVSRLPHDLRSEEKLQEYVVGLGLGPVETTKIVRHTGKLDRKIHRREKALLALEKAHIKLAKNVCNTIKGRRFGLGIWPRLFGRNNVSSQDILEAGETKEHQRIQSLVDWLNPRKKKSDNNQIQNIMNQEDGYGRQFLIWDALSHISKPVLDRFQPFRRIGFIGSGKVLSIDHFLKKFNYLDRRIAELRLRADQNSVSDTPNPYKPTDTGFVTFRDHISAQICAQSIISSIPHTCTTRMAPEPRDLLWENLIMRFRESMLRYVIVNACVWALTIFWLFPIVAFLTLTSISSLSSRISFLGSFLEATPAIRTLLQNVLPTVLVSFFMAILPWILMEISKQECFASYSELEEAGATFFINYVVFNTCTHGLELVQIVPQLCLHIMLTCRFIATTPLFKHQFAYCYVRRYEAGGKLYRRVFRYTTDGLIIFQLTVLGVIWLRKAITQGSFIIPLIIATGYFKYYCHKTFHSRTNYLALDTRSNQQNNENLPIIKENPESPVKTLLKNDDENYDLKIDTDDNYNNKSIPSQMIETNADNIDNILIKRAISDEFHGSDSESSTKYNSSTNMLSKTIDENNLKLSNNNNDNEEIPIKPINLNQSSIDKVKSEKIGDYGTGTQQSQHPKSTEIIRTNITDEKIDYDNSTSTSPFKGSSLRLKLVPPNPDPSNVRILTSSPVSCPDLGVTRPPLRSSRSAMHPTILMYDPNREEFQDESSQYQSYAHPNLIKDLTRRLWLPKNPLKTITIEDTVELSRALTSSDGGIGIVGYWGEASTYLTAARVSEYGGHEFPLSPGHQRGATASTGGVRPGGHYRRKTSSRKTSN
ncbi:22709_t:CDS:2, partial [Gigaspora margarita]